MTTVEFPEGFLWGAATASYQIEGAAHEAGRGESIWDTFARQPGAVINGDDGSVACDHFHRMPQDVALMKRLGLDSYRFSIAWPRVMPDGRTLNPEGLQFYSNLVDELLNNGITPWLTLYHWDLPQALEDEGGWTNRAITDDFVNYALAVHDALGDRVKYWTTLNEPWCSSMLGYGAGIHAPGRRDGREALTAVHHLLLGHGKVVNALRERDPELELGLTLNFGPAVPAHPGDEGDEDAARRADGVANRLFIEPLMLGSYPQDVIEDCGDLWPTDAVHDGDLEIISTDIEVLGVNYYSSTAVSACPPANAALAAANARQFGAPTPNIGSEHVVAVPRGLPVSDMGWEITPDALRDLLLRLQKDYTGPRGVQLYITENGMACDDHVIDGQVDDQQRIDYLVSHMSAVREAMDGGAEIKGYFVWSLMDNYEWAFGYTKRFGIVFIDYETQQRIPKRSFDWYSHVIEDNGFETSRQ